MHMMRTYGPGGISPNFELRLDHHDLVGGGGASKSPHASRATDKSTLPRSDGGLSKDRPLSTIGVLSLVSLIKLSHPDEPGSAVDSFLEKRTLDLGEKVLSPVKKEGGELLRRP
jgi:hypothetical protein